MKSWITSANAALCPFPIQNLPFGVFSRDGEPARCGVAIGDRVLDLAALEAAGLIVADAGPSVFDAPALNPFMALGPATWEATGFATSSPPGVCSPASASTRTTA